jgi:hypothetical protein
VLWLKANTLSSQANGSNVSTWADQSGYNNNAAAPSGNEPVYDAPVTTIYNNNPTVRFFSTNTDYLRIVDASSLKPNTISIFIVGKYLAGTTNWSPFIIKTNSYSWSNGYGITVCLVLKLVDSFLFLILRQVYDLFLILPMVYITKLRM